MKFFSKSFIKNYLIFESLMIINNFRKMLFMKFFDIKNSYFFTTSKLI